MKLTVLKVGNLLGSPDVKELLHRCPAGVDHALWSDLERIKLSLGYNGQCTTLLLEHDALHGMFPALVDPSFITAAPAKEPAVDLALRALEQHGVDPAEIRSILLTHAHLDHWDPLLTRALKGASLLAHPDSGIPGCAPFSERAFDGNVAAVNTPGHGCPHSSYIVDLPELDLALCLAGDLIMSHAHYLALDHPLSFANAAEGRSSIATVMDRLRERRRAHSMIFPGHDLPFFVDP